MKNPSLPFGHRVILELKFTDRFPDWCRHIVEHFGLMQCGAAKYADGVALCGEHRITRAFAFDDRHTSGTIPNRSERTETPATLATAGSAK